MLEVCFKPYLESTRKFKFGEYIPGAIFGGDPNNVVWVSASDYELLHIKLRFDNIPMASSFNETVKWYGDHAKFIVANWNLPKNILDELVKQKEITDKNAKLEKAMKV